ncbi:SOS response-associated peptidase family protein [Rhizobium sp. BK376]|uniref:SOS response-associated peptidase n=1 Tax=Rhizobium sp. BK376 TaxID=2512149 RepID=UPI00104D6812|nr:SOS response-associated peptidase family protein [Rhizobium sp. BK376]TCR85233.1 putative SOS response-associated peptidase YedK [Rhizobium sp. BK376]
MCNLYTVRKSAAEVAAHFGVLNPILSNAPDEVYPGGPGLVVVEQEGAPFMRSMTWGFPLRLKGMKPEAKPKPVNNVADLTKGMWIGLARKPQWRCLIPVTHFAEPEGAKGAKTRTWFSLRDEPIFAWAGLWRVSDEWGPVYSGVMTDANEAIAPVHDRMPVLLHRNEYQRWLNGSFDEALAFQRRVFPPDRLDMDRTSELWVKRKTPGAEETLLL